MPHINRIRVNNVKYNFGTQSYEDFLLKPFGRNMLYDLANGGGKSVLMLLMLQNVLPNCSLDEKQPVEKLFRTGDGSQTIHSLIEWKLDDCDVVDGFRYMTTGFCARKAQNAEEERRETASIEYFNYCIFYRQYNDNDIRNLPLVKNKEKITYSGLRRYLKELERDNSLIVRVFDRKGEYQSFIADYGLYESEWEIIRGINKTEGHVRTYFETNYRTTRKVVEDLLIEEIIQKSFRLRGGLESDDSMSKTLLEMKDKLLELSRKKSEIGNFDRQMELLSMFAGRVESLKEVYESLSSLKSEIAGLYQLAGVLEGDCTAKEEQWEQEIRETDKEILLLREKIDAARYCEDKSRAKKLESEMKQLEKEVSGERAELDKNTRQLVLRESMNDYLEYQQEKAKRDEISVELNAMQTEKSTLLEELKYLAHHMKVEIARRQKALELELVKLETRYSSLRIRKKSVDEKERELSHELAVSQTRAEEYERSLNELAAKIGAAKRQVGILVLEDSDRLLEDAKTSKVTTEREIEETEAQKQRLSDRLAEQEKELLSCTYERKQLTEASGLSEEFFAAYQDKKQQADKLVEVYGVRDYEKLRKELRERGQKGRQALEQIEVEKSRLAEWLAAVQEDDWGGFLQELPEAQSIREYLKTRHKCQVKTGREYLQSVREEQRKQLLQDYPYLPYALILDTIPEAVLQDEKLRSDRDGVLLFPLIKEAALRNGRELFSAGDMSLISKDFSVYCEEGALEKEQARVTAQLSEVNYRERRQRDQLVTYEEDEQFLNEFLYGYEVKYQESRRQQEEREKAIVKLAEREEAAQKEQSRLRAEMAELKRQEERLQKQVTALTEDITVLAQLSEDFKKQEEMTGVLKAEQERQEQKRAEQENARHQLQEMEQEAEEVTARRNTLNAQIERMNADWKEKYAAYEEPGEYEPCTLTGEALEAELSGKRLAYEKEYSQTDDKKRLLQSYVSAMNRCLKAITNRGTSVSLMQEFANNDELYVTGEKEIARMREENNKAELHLAAKQRKLESITAEWNRLHGKTSQLAAELSERYGAALELAMPEEGVEEFIEANRSQIERLLKKSDEQKKTLKELRSEAVLFADMKKDIERMARADRLSLQQTAPAGEAVSAAELKERFYRAETEYENNRKEFEKRKEEFARNRQMVIDTLKLLDAEPLAQEMQESITLPLDEAETAQMVKNLLEVRECLALEKSRVESGLEDIINLKDNFENQCLQRCVNIKTELDRLSKLSRITLGDEQISMISLQIPYVKEEFFKERMSGYIDEIVANVDEFREQGERLKYIRNALSFKKLFSVIVSDMNAIRLSLYKRERIREQSRHLRYEEAVGSTGQSQGIYIQFLIAIINYITSINSGKNDNTMLGKVIFIDNPFGAAKDIYIWEPIFELLRTNHVQLIVPARGTTPAITGRFDVNYILGQKLVDGKQQTVVVDYRSSVETEEMEYIPLQYEQESFDFL